LDNLCYWHSQYLPNVLGFFFFLAVLGGWNQGFDLGRQALYHLSHVFGPFCSGPQSFYFTLPAYGWDNKCIPPSPACFHWDMSYKLLFGLGWFRTIIIQITVSLVGRFTGMSHWHPASKSILLLILFRFSLHVFVYMTYLVLGMEN
jgi:hypothetical protein